MTDLLLDGDSQGKNIRSLFHSQKHLMSMRSFTNECIRSCLFDEMQLENFKIVGAMKSVKLALKEGDEHGIQFAYNTSKTNGDKAIWKQTELLSHSDAIFVLENNYIDKLVSTHAKARAFQDWIRNRWGTAPSIPDLVN